MKMTVRQQPRDAARRDWLADQDRDDERGDDAKCGENNCRPEPPSAFRPRDQPRRTDAYTDEGRPDQPVPQDQQRKSQGNDDDHEEHDGQGHCSVSGAQ